VKEILEGKNERKDNKKKSGEKIFG